MIGGWVGHLVSSSDGLHDAAGVPPKATAGTTLATRPREAFWEHEARAKANKSMRKTTCHDYQSAANKST